MTAPRAIESARGVALLHMQSLLDELSMLIMRSGPHNWLVERVLPGR